MKLTEEAIKNLHLAIDRAQGPGRCEYVVEGAPYCVIAQLLAIEGVPLDVLRTFGSSKICAVNKTPFLQSILEKYGEDLVFDLQYVWDTKIGDEDERRQRMRRRVGEASQ